MCKTRKQVQQVLQVIDTESQNMMFIIKLVHRSFIVYIFFKILFLTVHFLQIIHV